MILCHELTQQVYKRSKPLGFNITINIQQASSFQEPTLNSEEIPITSTMWPTPRWVNRISAGDVTNPNSVAVTVVVTGL